MKQVLLAAALGMSALAPSLAHAAGPYVGVGISRPSSTFDQSGKLSPKLFGGYDFNNSNYGIEVGYTRVPSATISTWGPDVMVNNNVPLSYRSSTAYVTGVARWPINDKFGLVTKLGVAHTRHEIGVRSGPFATLYGTERSNNNGLYAGLGLQVKLTEKVSLTLEVERTGKRPQWSAKPVSVSINAGYRF